MKSLIFFFLFINFSAIAKDRIEVRIGLSKRGFNYYSKMFKNESKTRVDYYIEAYEDKAFLLESGYKPVKMRIKHKPYKQNSSEELQITKRNYRRSYKCGEQIIEATKAVAQTSILNKKISNNIKKQFSPIFKLLKNTDYRVIHYLNNFTDKLDSILYKLNGSQAVIDKLYTHDYIFVPVQISVKKIKKLKLKLSEKIVELSIREVVDIIDNLKFKTYEIELEGKSSEFKIIELVNSFCNNLNIANKDSTFFSEERLTRKNQTLLEIKKLDKYLRSF